MKVSSIWTAWWLQSKALGIAREHRIVSAHHIMNGRKNPAEYETNIAPNRVNSEHRLSYQANKETTLTT